ncbi:hypothetical protein [Zobellia roscoffensis]|uniref:hypothetical protein n=1 Tax=Zobellia roscoffensis TaxID=2779508 RepID=UPI00188BAFD6|nr:hypothetical protein [Zobellia roscoffensis]
MNKEEFNELADRSLLKNSELGKLLGVGRGTIHNYRTGKTIPDTKVNFIREVLLKSPKEIRELLDNGDLDMSIERVLPFVIEHFDELMAQREFRNLVSTEAYDIANVIIKKKLNESSNKA